MELRPPNTKTPHTTQLACKAVDVTQLGAHLPESVSRAFNSIEAISVYFILPRPFSLRKLPAFDCRNMCRANTGHHKRSFRKRNICVELRKSRKETQGS